MQIQAIPKEDFDIPPIATASIPHGYTWGDYIRKLANEGGMAVNTKNYGSLYTSINNMHHYCTLLNIIADKKIKESVDQLTEAMHRLKQL